MQVLVQSFTDSVRVLVLPLIPIISKSFKILELFIYNCAEILQSRHWNLIAANVKNL